VTLVERLRAVELLCQKLPRDITRVIGVARSGLFAAGVLAERLHVPLWSISPATGPLDLGHGARLQSVATDGVTLVVDDTAASGYSLSQLEPVLPADSVFACLYCAPQCRQRVRLFAELLPLPHYLEWNLFNSVHTATLATDIDGVLCPDPPEGLSECQYERWLQNAPLWQRPLRDTLPVIATGRRRRYRKHTEQWLAERGIRYQLLVVPESEIDWLHPAEMKADAYAASSATVFVESDPQQARAIANRSKKRVICPATKEVFN
jgi:hypothetical protein